MPASSRIKAILEQVVTALNAGTFSQSFTAARAYTTRIDVSQIADLTVKVVPRERDSEIKTRAHTEEDTKIDVGVFKLLAGFVSEAADLTEIDGLMTLTEEIQDTFTAVALATTPPARCLKVEMKPIYDQIILKESRVFACVITFSFREVVS